MKVTQVPYRGAGPALNDLLAGQVDLSSQSAVQAGPLVKAGKLKAYAIIGRTGSPACPTCRPWASSATRSSISISGTCCSRPPARRARSSTSSNAALRHALADARVQKDLCRRRHGPVSARPGNARSRERAAQERDQALGRRDPRQQHLVRSRPPRTPRPPQGALSPDVSDRGKTAAEGSWFSPVCPVRLRYAFATLRRRRVGADLSQPPHHVDRCRSRPAAPPTRSRASSRTPCRRRSASRSWSRTSAAPAARSAPPASRAPSPTATPS